MYAYDSLCFVSVYCPNDGRIYTIDDFTGQVKLLTWTENGKHHAYCHRLGYTMQNWDKESKMIDSFNVSLEAKDYGDIIISTLKSKQNPMPTNIPKRAIQSVGFIFPFAVNGSVCSILSFYITDVLVALFFRVSVV